jgi:putative peptidoglycan lipid II flippase
MAREFQRHARTVTLLTFASRVGGLARDAAMSRVFGAGSLMDAFAFAFMVPNLFRRLFGEGALSAAFLPEYARWSDRDPIVAQRLAWIVVGGATVVVSALVIAAEIVAGALAASGTLEPLAWRLLAIMLPFAPLVCLTALLGAMLQAHHRFGPTAAAPIVLNLLLVGASLAGLSLEPDFGITIVAWAVLAAGVVQVLWSMLALRRVAPISRGQTGDEATRAAKQVARLALPMILGLGVLQLNTLLDGFIASWPTMFGPTILGVDYPLAEGSMAKLSWAQRLYEFPLGVFGIAVATAIFPALARLAGDSVAFAQTLRRGVRLVIFIGLPASAGLMLVAEPLSAVVLQGRAFTPADTRATAWILLGYAPAVWAYSLNQVLVRGFYARGDSMTPVRIAMGLVALNLVLNVTLIWTPLGTAGLAWSTAICAMLQTAWLMRAMTRKFGSAAEPGSFRLVDRAVWSSVGRSVIATAAMTAVVWCSLRLVPELAEGWWNSLAALLVAVSIGGATMGLAAVALRMPELAWALGRSGSGDR